MGNAVIKVNPGGGLPATYTGLGLGPISVLGKPIPKPNIQPAISVSIPPQIAGLVPLYPCGSSDCRDSQQVGCYMIPAFGVSSPIPNYENDVSSWLVDTALNNNPVQFAIYKATPYSYAQGGPYVWNQVAAITNNNYGINYAVGKIPSHPTYQGFAVNWGLVLAAFGPGIYRIGLNSISYTIVQASTIIPINSLFPTSFLGTVKIGTWSATAWWAGTTAQNMAYLVALINSSGKYTASYAAGNLNIYGTNGASSNGIWVSINGKWLTDGNPYITTKQLSGGTTYTPVYTCLSQTPPFIARAFNCQQAHGTVKFETWLPNVIGSVTTPGTLFDLCGINWYDSTRLYGFFGYKKFNYNPVTYEYGINNTHIFGLEEDVRDKAVPSYKFNSKPIPQWVQDTLAIYGFMAQLVKVSDYNLNNSDWTIQQRVVKKKSGCEPTYLNAKNFSANMRYKQRRSYMSMDFEEGIQSIIMNYCCLTS